MSVSVFQDRDNNRRFRDPFARFDRGSAIDEGSRRTGKTAFLTDMLRGKIPPMAFDYDRYIYFSDSPVDGIHTTPYRDMTTPRGREGTHSVIVFDDPPMENPEFRTMLNQIARNGRHEGISAIVTLHAVQDMGSSRNPYLNQNTDMVIVPSKYASKHINSIKRHRLFGDSYRELNRNPNAFNYNIVNTRGDLSIIERGSQGDERFRTRS